MSSSASILPQSQSTTISGGEFNNSAGGQNRVVVNCHIHFDQGTQINPGNELTLTGSQNPLAPSDDSGEGPSTPLLNPGMQPHNSVTPEDHASTEDQESPKARYEAHLMAKGHGFPLWAPQPHSGLPLSYRRKGVSVGDVGIITREGYFDFLFNICLPRGHASNPEFLPINFSQVSLSSADISEWCEHYSGSCFLSSSTKQLRGLTFDCNGPKGSILVMPNGAYHQDLLNRDKFLTTLSQNAENWYRFAIGARGRHIRNGELQLVTGCDKTNSWGIATYSDFRPGPLTLVANSVQSHVEYTWDYEGRVEAKAGPRLDESLDAAGRQQYPQNTRNQCTFLRSFTVTLADEVWKTMVSTLIKDSSDNRILNSPEPRSYLPYILSRLFLGFGGRGGSSNGKRRSFGSEKPTTHPATAINQMLLSQYPNARVAISHDNDWCAVIRKDETTMPDASELLDRIRKTFISHFSENGTVYLSQEHTPQANSQRQSLSSDGFTTIPEFSGCAQGASSNPTGSAGDVDGKTIARACFAINNSHIYDISGNYINISSATGEPAGGFDLRDLTANSFVKLPNQVDEWPPLLDTPSNTASTSLTGVGIPTEILLHILQYIPDDSLQGVLGINRLFYDIAMNLRYRDVLIATRKRDTLKSLVRLHYPEVPRCVRRLEIRLNSMTLKGEHGDSESAGSIQKLKQDINNALRRVLGSQAQTSAKQH